MYKIGSEVELPTVTGPGRDGPGVEQVSKAVPAEWSK